MESWKIRDEILRSVSQWYLILAMIVLGGLLGYLIAYLVPSPYRATADIYVGIDVIRVNEMEHVIPLAEEEPLNLDDYKNWQLKQTADILTSSSVVGKTLSALQEMDSSWESLSKDDLRKAMDIYWYDAGAWQMEITFPDKDRAAAAVQTWIDAGHEVVSDLLEISKSAAELDNQLWSLNTAISRLKGSKASLKTFLSKGEKWAARLEEQDGTAPLDGEILTELDDWIRVYNGEVSAWQAPLEDYPQPGQNAVDYSSWLEGALSTAETALDEIQPQIDILQDEREEILPEYQQSLEDSLGLSANVVLLPNTSGVTVSPVRPTDSITLGGAFLGFLAWILFAVFKIRNSREDNG